MDMAFKDEAYAPEELEDEAARKEKSRREAFATLLVARRSEAIRARSASGVERRWIADTDAYHGRDAWNKAADMLDGLTASPRQGPDKKQARRRSTQFVQKTRVKTNSAAAHLSDLMFPTHDKNWRLSPTPIPELMSAMKGGGNQTYIDPQLRSPLPNPQTGEPLTQGEVVADSLKIAREKCSRMEAEIDDQLVECQYNAEGRKVIADATELGTGVMRGPIVVTRTKKQWTRKTGPDGKTYYDAKVSLDPRPASNRVDPWNCYPAPGCGENIHDGSYFFEREIVSPAHLKDLAKIDGFDREAILACLKETPLRARESDSRHQRGGTGEYVDTETFDTTNYELWLYWGEATPEDLEAMGETISDDLRMQAVSAAVVMCNDRPIKAMLNPQDFGEIPYDFFVWERMAGSPWGVGIPYLMRYAQKAMNASWRQMQDNAGLSHGPQIVMNRKGIYPADRDWEVVGNKLWFSTDEAQDVNKAFGVYQINNNQEQLERLFQIANQLADDETAMPQLMQGDQNGSPDTVGVARIIANSASVMLKRYAMNWDDRITTPHLRRYYDWNMQYSPKEDIKGDYMVQAIGATHLVVKDQRNQDIANTLAMMQDPAMARFISKERLAKAQVQATALRETLLTEEEILEADKKAAQQPPPQDPRIEAARMAVEGRMQVEQMKAQATIAAEQVEAQSEAQNIALRAEEAARNDYREMARLQLQRDLEILKMANQMQMSVQQIKADLAMETMKVTAQVGQSAIQQREAENTRLAEQAEKDMGEFKKP